MPLHDQLLVLARELVDKNPGAPREGDLRRAVSTAYYAVFHLLIHEGTERLVAIPNLRGRFARAFEHRIMNLVCGEMVKMKPTSPGAALPTQLRNLAEAFVELQTARLAADYDTGTPLPHKDANVEVIRAELAFLDWAAVQADPAADFFLTELLCRSIRGR